MNKAALWIAAIVLLTVIAVGGFLFYQRLTASIDVLVEQGPGTPAANSSSPLSAVDEAALEERLLAVGLNPQPVLGDTGVNGHLQRQETGEVSEETLNQYADDLALLNQMSSQEGSRIPTDFWDVRTKAMTELDWDEYSVVQHLASPEMAPYVRLLAQGYDRFLQFKDGEEVGEETALDAALDMFALVETYYESVPASNLTEHAPGIEGEAEEVLLIWQSLVAGSTRINPLTGNPMFNHSIYARDNVGTIYQYDQDQAMSISDVWGVTGFAPHFVGMPKNNNQVEHMSISMVLQLLLGEPVLVLDAIEEEKVVLGKADSAEAQADMALNNAIHQKFAPLYRQSRQEALEQLRTFLKDEG